MSSFRSTNLTKKDIGSYQTNTEQSSRISNISIRSPFERKLFNNEIDITDALNQYFTNIGRNIAAKKTPEDISYKSYLNRYINHVFHFETVTETNS